ncbi:MAG: CBS domain-containing protein [Anaerolineales bacterium]
MTPLVHELMHHGLITCSPDTTLGQAARRMYQSGVHALVVVDREGKPVGMLSDFDLLTGEWLTGTSESLAVMRRMTGGEMMSAPLHTIEAHAPASQAAASMRELGIHRLLVMEAGRPVGVISIGDLIKSLAEIPGRRATVGDVMAHALVVCREGTRLKAAARAMTDRRSRSILVVDAAGRPRGVVTGWDLLEVCGDDCGDRVVDDVMHPPIAVAVSAPLREAVDRMIQHRIHRLVVLDPDHPDAVPLGIISTADIFTEMARPGSVWLPAGA